MDIIKVNNGRAEKLYDVKFPNDRIDNVRFDDYTDMADKLDADYETYDVTKECDDWPENCPNPKSVKDPVTVTEEEPMTEPTTGPSVSDYFVLGGLTVLFAAAVLCPFDGPVGDVVTGGLLATQAASMGF